MMSSHKELKQAQKSAAEQQQTVRDLSSIVKDVEHCERVITDLQRELSAINDRFQGPRSTRQDVDYLTALLACARKKLVWEKQLSSLQKRTPAVLDRMARLLNDAANPPAEQMRTDMLRALQGVQAAMERLQQANIEGA